MTASLAVDDLGAVLDRIEVVVADFDDDEVEQVDDWLRDALSVVRREQDRRHEIRRLAQATTESTEEKTDGR